MKKLGILLIMISLCLANIPVLQPSMIEPTSNSDKIQQPPKPLAGRILIGQIGDMRSVLGPQSRNIAVSSDGNTIAVVYGPPSDPYNTNNAFGGVFVAYSTDRGASFSAYGPVSQMAPLRRIYPGVDGWENFHDQAGNLFFGWQEGQLGYDPMNGYSMIEENVPSAPSFSSPQLFVPDIHPWWLCPAVNPDDNLNVIMTAYSYVTGGNQANYAWISDDGGYTWSDTVRVTPETYVVTAGSGGGGHVRWGTGGYVFFTYHDSLGGVEHPYYVESTDGGWTWSAPQTVPSLSAVNFWWHDEEGEVISNIPFMMHNDTDASGFTQIFYPDPNNPGSVGAWNWQVYNVDLIGNTVITYHDTTWTVQVGRNANKGLGLGYDATTNTILATFRAGYQITPAPAGWVDGQYLGGIISYNNGLTWHVSRPLSGNCEGDIAIEIAHRLATVNETTFVYSTWEDAGDAIIGNQYFELGIVLPIQDSVGIAELNNANPVPITNLVVAPSISRSGCGISFATGANGNVGLEIFDITGRCVSTVHDGYLEKGMHTMNVNAANLASGVYIVSLKTATDTRTAKLVITH